MKLETRFNGVHSRDNLPDKIKDGGYVINLDEYSDIETHWITLYVNTKIVTYFDSFGVAYDSVICRYFCIGFMDFVFKGNSLTDFTNLFSSSNFKTKDDIILNYFLTNL